MIISKTPLRISLIGGGTDMPQFYEKHRGVVLSFAIDKFVYVSVNKKFDDRLRISYSKTENVDTVDQIENNLIRETLKFAKKRSGLEIVTVADIPGSGTGLGSSSAMTVGLLNCLYKNLSPNWLAETAFDIEANYCHLPVGKQDHYASALGGMNFLQFSKDYVNYKPVAYKENLEKYMLLLWTGISRPSSDILTKQKEGFSDGSTEDYGVALSKLARETVYDFVDRGDMPTLGEHISAGWKIKKKLSPWITNEWVDDWYLKAMQNGAYGGKLLGAGGGGFLFFIAPPASHARIIKAVGLRAIPFKIENRGSEVIYSES